MRKALIRILNAGVIGVVLALAGIHCAGAADSLGVAGENPLRLAQDIPTQPKMIAPEIKMLAISVVPDLRGRTEAQSRDLLAKAGLRLGKVAQISSQQAAGTVVRQSPLAKQTATKGSAVDIWIAAAPPPKVPDLIGRPLKEAEALLQKSGFRLGQVSSMAANYPKGSVARQSPAANSTADKGTPVSVWVAAAKPPPPPSLVQVPELVNRHVKEAGAILDKSGLLLGQVTRVPSDAADGMVLRQSPAAGQGVKRNSRVNVWVAQAGAAPPANQVRVPDVLKRHFKDAEQILLKSELRLGEVTQRPSDAPEGTVLSQSPSPGKSVEKDSPVNVAVAEPRLRVPGVLGNSLGDAEAILKDAGLRMRTAGREESKYPEGTVARQAPARGQVAARGDIVQVWIAEAAVVAVPDLRGLPLEDVQQRLRESRLEPGGKSERPSLPPAGRVVDQKPAAGAEVKPGSRVDVAVGDGSRAEVPGIVGEIEGTALERLEVSGLRAGERRTEESERREGEVLGQRPAAGSIVARGSPVAYVVAVPRSVAVPRVVGLMAGDALGQLEPLGLEGAEMGAEESDRPEGEILRQEPRPGARVPRGTRVEFWVASPAPVTVPDVSGLTGPEADEHLGAEGLVAGGRQSEESRAPKGTVVRQEPAAGARVPRGTPVDLWLATPALVPVPGLSGLRADDARARLAGAGLAMMQRQPEENDAPEGTVIGQEPLEGTPVPLGAEIEVLISAGRPFVVPPWVIGGGIGAALLAAGGGLWLARRPPRAPERPPSPPAKPDVRVRMDEPDAALPDGLTLDPKLPAVGLRGRLVPGDSEVSSDKELVVREERRQT